MAAKRPNKKKGCRKRKREKERERETSCYCHRRDRYDESYGRPVKRIDEEKKEHTGHFSVWIGVDSIFFWLTAPVSWISFGFGGFFYFIEFSHVFNQISLALNGLRAFISLPLLGSIGFYLTEFCRLFLQSSLGFEGFLLDFTDTFDSKTFGLKFVGLECFFFHRVFIEFHLSFFWVFKMLDRCMVDLYGRFRVDFCSSIVDR